MNVTSLYTQLHEIGVVKSQYEFSRLCGRKNTWLSSIKAHRRPISVAALYTLSQNLKRKAQQSPKAQLECAYASVHVLKALEQRCANALEL